jgi:hypothetical protein
VVEGTRVEVGTGEVVGTDVSGIVVVTETVDDETTVVPISLWVDGVVCELGEERPVLGAHPARITKMRTRVRMAVATLARSRLTRSVAVRVNPPCLDDCLWSVYLKASSNSINTLIIPVISCTGMVNNIPAPRALVFSYTQPPIFRGIFLPLFR